MKKTKLLFLLFFGVVLISNAQQAVLVSGGNAAGSDGTASYSIGQTVYTSYTGSSGSLAEGVQQPFEMQTVLGIENDQINLSFLVYPNPTVSKLILELGDMDFSTTSYQLFNLEGRLLLDKKITQNSTAILFENYPKATYLLHIQDNNKTIKTFKIIKN